MTEALYFQTLRALLESRLCCSASGANGTYEIKEVNQAAFFINPKNVKNHLAISLEKLPGTEWACFRQPHAYAHKRCDRIFVGWNSELDAPVYLLCELKSLNSAGAWTQIQASLAFCHFAHRMVIVNQTSAPTPKFGAVTIKEMPFAAKLTSIPSLPVWTTRPEQKECPHMIFLRNTAMLPLRAILQSL